jgi:hypothetical protein
MNNNRTKCVHKEILEDDMNDLVQDAASLLSVGGFVLIMAMWLGAF